MKNYALIGKTTHNIPLINTDAIHKDVPVVTNMSQLDYINDINKLYLLCESEFQMQTVRTNTNVNVEYYMLVDTSTDMQKVDIENIMQLEFSYIKCTADEFIAIVLPPTERELLSNTVSQIIKARHKRVLTKKERNIIKQYDPLLYELFERYEYTARALANSISLILIFSGLFVLTAIIAIGLLASIYNLIE